MTSVRSKHFGLCTSKGLANTLGCINNMHAVSVFGTESTYDYLNYIEVALGSHTCYCFQLGVLEDSYVRIPGGVHDYIPLIHVDFKMAQTLLFCLKLIYPFLSMQIPLSQQKTTYVYENHYTLSTSKLQNYNIAYGN